MLPDINQLHALLSQAAEQELMPRFGDHKQAVKSDGSIVTSADFAVQRYVQNKLAEHWPRYCFISEETSEQERDIALRNQREGVWCLDPLDGTSNFAAGVPFFAISLALIIQGQPAIGLVYDPIRDECFSAKKGEGAWLNNKRLRGSSCKTLLRKAIAVVDFKRLNPQLAGRLAQYPPYHSQRNFGSVALEWSWLAADRFHVYLHGGQKLWDYAAGSLILNEAGGQALTLEGEQFAYMDLKVRSAVAALDTHLFNEWKESIGI